MNKEIRKLIDEAIQGVTLKDVVLFDSRFERPTPPSDDLVQEHKSNVTYTTAEVEVGGERSNMLQAFVELGIRLITPVAEGENPTDGNVALVIEARFVLNYQIHQDVSEAAIKAFARFNAVYNAWPFWRQHVYDICQRGHLPTLEVPLRPGLPRE